MVRLRLDRVVEVVETRLNLGGEVVEVRLRMVEGEVVVEERWKMVLLMSVGAEEGQDVMSLRLSLVVREELRFAMEVEAGLMVLKNVEVGLG